MNVRICIPWRTDHAHRDRLWRYCFTRWRGLDLGYRLCLADSHDEPFSRARSINKAAEGDWDVVVVADADVVVPSASQVRQAVKIAADRDCQVFGFTTKYMLSKDATERVLLGDVSGFDPAEAIDSSSNTKSSLFAVNRHLWDRLGGFDDRFVGWGFEDLAFLYAAETIGAQAMRVDGEIYDLWHPRPRELQEEGPCYSANEKMWREYWGVWGNREGMEELLAERYS